MSKRKKTSTKQSASLAKPAVENSSAIPDSEIVVTETVDSNTVVSSTGDPIEKAFRPNASKPKLSKPKPSKKEASDISTVTKFSRKLHYKFTDDSLLLEAITHRSKHSLNNERLEFLGDSVLGYVISSELFQRFPQAREGQLTRGRAALVKGETLAELALEMDLGDYLLLGPGELKSGGHRRKSILADAMEAIIGAIYLDGGLEAAKQHIIAVYSNKLESLSLDGVDKDPKTRLQEYLQAGKHPLPEYKVVATSGSDHDQLFKVSCRVSVISEIITGMGRSRRKAEQDAAAKMLKMLHKVN